MTLFRLIITVIFLTSVTKACTPCLDNVLSSDGDFGVFFPRYLGNWVLSGDYDGNPFYTCPWDCHGLRSFLLFIRDDEVSPTGYWAITDCRPDQAEACGGAAHKIIKSPKVNSEDICPHQISTNGWQWCDGDLQNSGTCTSYATDNTIKFTCQN